MERQITIEDFDIIPDNEMQLLISGYLESFGYQQVIDKDAYIALRNTELDLHVRVLHNQGGSFRIYFKYGQEWNVVETVNERTDIAETIKQQGYLVYKELMMERGRQLLRQQNLLQE